MAITFQRQRYNTLSEPPNFIAVNFTAIKFYY